MPVSADKALPLLEKAIQIEPDYAFTFTGGAYQILNEQSVPAAGANARGSLRIGLRPSWTTLQSRLGRRLGLRRVVRDLRTILQILVCGRC
jgi:hypothetical protein